MGIFSSKERPTPAPTPVFATRLVPAARPVPSHLQPSQTIWPNSTPIRSNSYASTTAVPRQYHVPQNWNHPVQPKPKVVPRVESIVATNSRRLWPSVYQQAETSDWNPMTEGSTFRLITLSPQDNDYRETFQLFRKTAQKQLKVVTIKRVENPYLLGCFLLKREETEESYGYVDEELLFHGTKNSNVNSICENNFNWRLHGESIGNKFGKGVSFSPVSNYASHYCDNKGNGSVNAMFLVRVIVCEKIVGNKNMELPDDFYDTAIKPDGKVVVKFCDNEFFPMFVIYYTGSPYQSNVHHH